MSGQNGSGAYSSLCFRTSGALFIRCCSLLAEAFAEHDKEKELEKEMRDHQRIAQSAYFSSLSAEEQTQHLAHLNSTRTRLEEQKSKNAAYTARLVDTAFWPVLAPFDVKEFEEKYNSMVQTTTDLRNSINETHTSIMRASTLDPSRTQPGSTHAGPSAAGPSTSGETTSRPTKRRRIDSPDEEASEAAQPQSEVDKAVEIIEDQISALHDRLAGLENEQNLYTESILDEFDSRLEDTVDKIANDTDVVANLVAELRVNGETSPVIQGKLKALEMALASCDKDIVDMSKEIAELITKNMELKKENDRLLQTQESLVQRIQQVSANLSSGSSCRLSSGCLARIRPSGTESAKRKDSWRTSCNQPSTPSIA